MKISLDDIKIRTHYKPGDIGYITYMHGIYYDYGPEFERYVAVTITDFYKHLNPKRERIWVAEYKNEIVGTIALKQSNSAAQLRYFIIAPPYRGIGLGTKLMETFMSYMKDLEYKSSFLLTEDSLLVAGRIYSKYGYQYVKSNLMDFGLKENRYELTL